MPITDNADDDPSHSVGSLRSGGGRRRLSLKSLAVGVALGVVLAIAAAVLLLKLTRADQPPELTADQLEAATTQWSASGPPAYEMTLVFSGRQSGTFRVQVEDGDVVSVTRDGVRTRPHTWDQYSVEGLLQIIRDELDFAKEPDRYFGASPGAEVIQQAKFDAELGYPARYRRAVMGVDQEIAWEITEFQVRP